MKRTTLIHVLLALVAMYAAVVSTATLARRPAAEPPGRPAAPSKLAAAPVQPSTLTNNPWFNVGLWVIDPANSTGCASDNNDCQRTTCGGTGQGPCLSFNGGPVSRWGTYSPRLQQQTIIEWLSSQSGGGDPVKLRPYIENGGQLIILGNATTVATVTISGAGFQSKNYASNQELQANLTASGAEGQFLNNQTHASVAWAYKSVSSNVFALSQPLNPNTTPITSFPAPEVDTWASTDSVKLQTFPLVDLVDLEPQATDNNHTSSPCTVSAVTVMESNGIVGSDNFTVGSNVLLQSLRSLKVINLVAPNVVSLPGMGPLVCLNCALEAGMLVNGGAYVAEGQGIVVQVVGGFLHAPAFGQLPSVGIGVPSISNASLDGDVILVGGLIDGGEGPIAVQGGSMGLVDVQGTITLSGQAIVNGVYSSGNNDGFTIWGAGILNLAGPSQLTYGQLATTAVNTFLLSGGLSINNTVKACSLGTGAAAAWNCNISLTPAALDAAVGIAGFGGLATDGAGASFLNINTRN